MLGRRANRAGFNQRRFCFLSVTTDPPAASPLPPIPYQRQRNFFSPLVGEKGGFLSSSHARIWLTVCGCLSGSVQSLVQVLSCRTHQ